MLQNGIIEESSSLYVFNVVVVGKKDSAREGMDRRMRTKNTASWHIIQKSTKRFVKFQEDFWY